MPVFSNHDQLDLWSVIVQCFQTIVKLLFAFGNEAFAVIEDQKHLIRLNHVDDAMQY